ncbi:NADP-dependent oxidoreductase domain-containing protein [Chytridium lagenaria]|nr:NADP-dependent oxidoreductase domain-containing protein [Chytridium lagenaria]
MTVFENLTTVTLSNGKIVPSLAYGTGTKWYVGVKGNERSIEEVNPDLVKAVVDALRSGFRHIDIAEMYGNELEVGVALSQFFKESGLKRSDVFITTKVYANIENIPKAIDDSLARLGPAIDGYVDLYLIHSPFWDKSKVSFVDAWKKMEDVADSGKAKSIGVSNYRIQDFEEIFKFARIKPVCNQIEYNPYLQDIPLKSFSDANGITTAAYAPLGPLTHYAQEGTVQTILDRLNAARRERNAPEISHTQWLLLWTLGQKGIAVTTTARKERMEEIISIQRRTVEATSEEIAEITKATEGLALRSFGQRSFLNRRSLFFMFVRPFVYAFFVNLLFLLACRE